MEAAVKDVVKWSYNGQDNTLGSGTDKVFFISAQEFGSDYQNNPGTGTGVNHDEAYLYYQQSANNSIGLTQDVWTRTVRLSNGYDMAYIRNGNVFLLDSGGSYGEGRGKRAWVPLFCI